MPVSIRGKSFDSTLSADLHVALRQGNPRQVQELISAGADIHYQRDGYNAVLDAVFGRNVVRDPNLLELLSLLIQQGVELSVVSLYEESALRVLSRLGRFDAVQILLAAGADKSQLKFTPLIEAVTLGTLADVQSLLTAGCALEEQDWWERTAWLFAILSGDIDKAALLREYGANISACGRCACPPLFYAINGHHPHMLRWLLEQGADVHLTDEFGETALMQAVEMDDLDCVEILLAAGACVDTDSNGTALSRATSRTMIMRLLAAGANPADADQKIILGLNAPVVEALANITANEFLRTSTRVFGSQNPEGMNKPFWEGMIRCGANAYRARDRFKAKYDALAEPVWCAERFGQSLTLLPDGRAIQIAGEHEDSYDPDFCIYNDVIIHHTDGTISIYGYPSSVFPPTDFHTATLMGDFIYIIGSLGYPDARRYGQTPVYRLDTHTLQIHPLPTIGDVPGWIYQHRAVSTSPHEIRVWGGLIVHENDQKESHDKNTDTFILDIESLSWRRDLKL